MNRREELIRQLNELESDKPEQNEAEESEAEPAKKSSTRERDPWNPRDWDDYVPPPRFITEKDIADDSGFKKIGDWYVNPWTGKREHRQPYPHPSYADAGAKLGDEITNRLMLEHARLDCEWYHAATDLENCIRWTNQKLKSKGYSDGCAWLNRCIETWEESDEKRHLEQTWAFLLGLWQGRGMMPPTEQQLEKWARGEE